MCVCVCVFLQAVTDPSTTPIIQKLLCVSAHTPAHQSADGHLTSLPQALATIKRIQTDFPS